MARVIVSSGHTSDNPGVAAYGLREYDVARKIAKFSLKYIRQAGIISLSTPPNLDLAQRIEWINNTGYNAGSNDIAIEVHINDGGKRGIEAWYEQDGNNPSQTMTNYLVEAVCQDMNLPSQGVKSEFQHEMGSISFISEVAPIACVIECCYIDNAEDAMLLGNDFNLEKIGRGIAKGVIKYFGLNIELPEVVAASATVQNLISPQQPQQTQYPNQSTQDYQMPVQQPIQQPVQVPVQQNVQQPIQTQQPAQSFFNQNSQPYQAQSVPNQPVTIPNQRPVMQPSQYGQTQQPVSANQQLQQFQSYQTPAYQKPSYQEPKADFDLPVSTYNRPTTNTYQAPTANNVNSTSSNTNTNKGGFLPREERKEMIIRNYAKILGREPNENDLNYFLNTGIREDELLKKMVDSQEHADLVKARQEVITAKMKMAEEQNELMTLRSKQAESETIINGLNASIAQKNEALSLLNKRIRELEQQKNNSSITTVKKTSADSQKKYKGNLSDRVFKAFSDILE